MVLPRVATSLGFVGLAALTFVVVGRPDHRDWTATEADRAGAAANAPEEAQTAGQAPTATPTPAPTQISAAGVTLQSVSVNLPDRGIMFSGPGSDAINNNCLACHSAGMVLNQPNLPRAAWEAEVSKMINAYKAPVEPQDVGAIIDYLVSIKGAKKS
jgi:cytochrome c5